jgi:hypothetical protein
MGQLKRREHVQSMHAVQVIDRGPLEAARYPKSGIVDEPVKGRGRNDLGFDLGYARIGGKIRREVFSVRTVLGLKLLRQGCQALFAPCRQDKVGAPRSQRSRKLGAEARAGSGDQGNGSRRHGLNFTESPNLPTY